MIKEISWYPEIKATTPDCPLSGAVLLQMKGTGRSIKLASPGNGPYGHIENGFNFTSEGRIATEIDTNAQNT